MGTLLQDLKHGLRMLAKSPGFTAVAVLTLALGIGANTAVFSIVNSVLLRPLAFRDSASLVHLYTYNGIETGRDTTLPDFLDWRARNHSFEELAGTWQNDANLLDQQGTEKIRSAFATANLFQTMGMPLTIGRSFQSTDDRLGFDHIAVLSYGLWQRRYGGDPAVLGKSVAIDNTSYTIVGVLARGFHFPGSTDLWMPMGAAEEALISFHDNRRIRATDVIGRLRAGVDLNRAATDMAVVMGQLGKEYPLSSKGWHVQLVPLMEDTVGASRKGLWILMGAAGCVLLIACANLAALLLGRGAARSKEFAIRSALGGSGLRILRQVVTETALLGLLGGIAGGLLAYASRGFVLSVVPRDLPRLDEIHFDIAVFAFTSVHSLLSGICFGVVPALQAIRMDLQGTLRSGGRQSRSETSPLIRKALITAEIACAFVLVVGASLLLRTFVQLLETHPGFNPRNVVTATIGFPDTYRTETDKIQFAKKAIARLEAVPGVRATAATSLLPLLNFKRGELVAHLDGETPESNRGHSIYTTIVTPGFFRVMEIPVISGRIFTEADDAAKSHFLVINQAAARKLWPGQNPLGKHVNFFWSGPRVGEVVGVVGDVKQSGVAAPIRPEMYVPFYGMPSPYLTFIVRAEKPLAVLAGTITDEIHKVDGTLAVYDLGSLEQVARESLSPNRFYLLLVGTFGLIALALAALGIYGVVSFSVAQRTQEFGVRLALGAQPSDVLRIVLGQGLGLAIGGVAIGLASALALTRLLANLLFGVSATDPVTFAGVAALLSVIALLACYIPARRAMRVDPIVALRYE
jgi:putative ABC transport system permease protein